jgi:type I restriction enzyme S subunit
MSSYRPYPKYKPSGVEWLGDVPEGWEVMKLSFVSYLRSGESITSTDIEEAGTYPVFGGNGHRGFTENYTHDGNFVIVGRQGALCGNVHFTSGKFWASEHALVANPLRKYNTRWFGEMLRAMNLGQYSVSAAQPGLSVENIGNLRLPFPPLPEQHQIAAFLDRECGKLDALQAKQERLIELLKEKRQALISHAVTRGLDPTAKLKPSGIEWLGEVPEHWTTPQLKFLIVGIDQGKSPECEARIAEPDEWGVMKSGCVNWGIFREEEHKALPPHIAPTLTTEVRKGDLLMSRASGSTDLIGSVAYVENVRPRLLLSDKIFRLKAGKACDPRFIWRMASTIPIRRQIELSINGAEGLANNITKESIRNLFFTLPPLAEQRAIVAHLDEKCGKIDQLKAKAERGIELLKERRSALISAAVTGKMDVREL